MDTSTIFEMTKMRLPSMSLLSTMITGEDGERQKETFSTVSLSPAIGSKFRGSKPESCREPGSPEGGGGHACELCIAASDMRDPEISATLGDLPP